MSYSQSQLESIAKSNPKELIRILNSSNADIPTLAIGAELLGELPDENVTVPILRKLLKHVNAVVRESAMIGISAFYTKNKPPQDILDKLGYISKTDPSTTNKEFAETILKDFNKLS